MDDLIELLGLDRETVENVSAAYTGFAEVLASTDQENLPWTASTYAIAAVYQILVEPLRSLKYFDVAASMYRELKNPYWKLLAVCSTNQPAKQNKPESFWQNRVLDP